MFADVCKTYKMFRFLFSSVIWWQVTGLTGMLPFQSPSELREFDQVKCPRLCGAMSVSFVAVGDVVFWYLSVARNMKIAFARLHKNTFCPNSSVHTSIHTLLTAMCFSTFSENDEDYKYSPQLNTAMDFWLLSLSSGRKKLDKDKWVKVRKAR